ncbi:hypothetical protein Bhyg_02003 [Pseudolycoriella hygida]|uniref:Uncharacterized protein n=1 Tax=Pseudolycoriella hygida TaxID=35572 RepID=A0A9Q0NCG0_9DIPT|nr:hypothetical protein Bhyg_02003 [Pseudolycoriella hygida]
MLESSKRVATVNTDKNALSEENRCISLKMLELSIELEKSRMNNRNLIDENDDLKRRIATVGSDQESDENHLKIIENIIAERNDLRELLDKFMGVTDQIIELKKQADHMKKVEKEYILLQNKFRDHQVELEALINDKRMFEERINELQTTNQEANTLKETNSKLEKDLLELSSVISVSNNFIHDQENEIQSKLRTITALNNEIEGLKVALSEAELKLNKKLRLEMDVELMEKELSIMIENSAENPNNHQVIDRQVEDLATAIKLTLGCMNYEFENDEEVNLVDANRQLKNLLLESSNKILEFKDVINKQEQNLLKVSHDFACKNDELTECLATVEELKRQLATNTATINNYSDTKDDFSNLKQPASPPTVDDSIEAIDKELFEKEINLVDSLQNSDEEDGPGIEDLESIFEKACHDKEQTDLQRLKASTSTGGPNRSLKIRASETFPVLSSGENRSLQLKLNDMISEISSLQKTNEELRGTILLLQQSASTKPSLSKSKSESLNEILSEKLPLQNSECTKEMENEIENLKLLNTSLVDDINKLKNSEDEANRNIAEMKNELVKLASINEELVAKLDNSYDKNGSSEVSNDRKNLSQTGSKDLEKRIPSKTGPSKQEQDSNKSQQNDSEFLPSKIEELENETATETQPFEKKKEKTLFSEKEVVEDMAQRVQNLAIKNEDLKRENEKLLLKIRCLELANPSVNVKCDEVPGESKEIKEPPTTSDFESQTETDWVPSNDDLVAEIRKLQLSENKSNQIIRQMEKDLKKLESINESPKDKKADLSHPRIAELMQQNEELKLLNDNLSVEIVDLKNQARSNASNMMEKMENLAAINKNLIAEIDELKRSDQETPLQSEREISSNPENGSHVSILRMEKDLERLAALNESILAFRDSDVDKHHALLEERAPDIHHLLKKNEELRNTNENLSTKIIELQSTETRAQFDAMESKNKLEILMAANERLEMQIKELQASSPNDRQILTDLEVENENLKSTNDSLVGQINILEEKLKNVQNVTEMNLKTSSAGDVGTRTIQPMNDYKAEIDWMVADMKKLRAKNENLLMTNEKLLSQINDLQSYESHSTLRDEIMNESGDLLVENQLFFDSKRDVEIESMKADLDMLREKNEELRTTNENLHAEVGALKGLENRNQKNYQQMEKDLLRLSAINERLSSQLNEKRLDKKQSTKASIQDPNASTSNSQDLLDKIRELSTSNESLALEIAELKSLDIVKMRNDLRRLSATNDGLRTQVSELKLMASNDLKMESDWMAADMKKLMNKNKKLNISNQNYLNEINELRKDFKSLEKHANIDALEKLKEIERLKDLNESLKNKIKNEKKNSKSNEIGLETLAPDAKKMYKKNEELKAANEKLLSVIMNLKNSEKCASSRATELESELQKLHDTNKNLRDTLENLVEKDGSKPKTELERICQSILKEGVRSLTDAECQYINKFFGRPSPDFEVPQTSRQKNATRKHCRICHQAMDNLDKNCECRLYEEKKRLHLLREIEETKLAIKHIQSSNDIEFDLNDVKNRLLKGKQVDALNVDSQDKVRTSKSQSQGNVNVTAPPAIKTMKCGTYVYK